MELQMKTCGSKSHFFSLPNHAFQFKKKETKKPEKSACGLQNSACISSEICLRSQLWNRRKKCVLRKSFSFSWNRLFKPRQQNFKILRSNSSNSDEVIMRLRAEIWGVGRVEGGGGLMGRKIQASHLFSSKRYASRYSLKKTPCSFLKMPHPHFPTLTLAHSCRNWSRVGSKYLVRKW